MKVEQHSPEKEEPEGSGDSYWHPADLPKFISSFPAAQTMPESSFSTFWQRQREREEEEGSTVVPEEKLEVTLARDIEDFFSLPRQPGNRPLWPKWVGVRQTAMQKRKIVVGRH